MGESRDNQLPGDPPPPAEGYELAEPAPAQGSRRDAGPTGRRQEKHVLSTPPPRRARVTAWLVLAGCVLLAAVPLAVDLGRPAVIHEHEARSVATAVETWRHQLQWAYADRLFETLVPTYNSEAQLEAPPGTTWAHMIAFRLLGGDPERAGTAQLVLAGRAVSMGAGLLVVAGIFWIGLTIGGLRTATLAGLIVAAHPLLLYHSRLATTEMPRVALMVLTLAAAIWAIGPLTMRGTLWRHGGGWALTGLALGLAVLTGGPTMLPLIIVPMLLFFVMYPHRLSHLMGLVAAGIIAILVTTPWLLYVHEQDAEVWQRWTAELIPAWIDEPALLGEVATHRLGLLMLVTLPWTAWLVAGLIQPFSTSSAGARLRMMLGWMWFVPVALLLLAAPGEPTMLQMLLIVPAAALLTGQVVRQFSDLSHEGRHARMWRLLRWPHAFVLMFASVALPGTGHLQEGMVRAGWLPGEVVQPMPAWYWVALGLVLMLLTILSMRFAERHRPGRTIACWAIWVLVAAACVAGPVARGPMIDSPVPRVGAELRQLRHDRPLYWLGSAESLDPRLVLFARRELRPATSAQLETIERDAAERVFVIAPADRTPPQRFEMRRDFADAQLTLWHMRPPTNNDEQAQDEIEDESEDEVENEPEE